MCRHPQKDCSQDNARDIGDNVLMSCCPVDNAGLLSASGSQDCLIANIEPRDLALSAISPEPFYNARAQMLVKERVGVGNFVVPELLHRLLRSLALALLSGLCDWLGLLRGWLGLQRWIPV